MALEQRLTVKQTQQLRMTPQLRQAIKILQVARGELEQMVAEEVEQNPVLEEVAGEQAVESDLRTGDVEKTEAEAPEAGERERETEANQLADIDWKDYIERYSDFHGSIGGGSDRDDNRNDFIENVPGTADDLTVALLDQLNLVVMSDEERRVGKFVIHNLDENGYLACPPEELAFMAACSQETLDDVREIIQEFEPPACGSLDLRDCILAQLRLLGYETDDYVTMVVASHLKDLKSVNYAKIAKAVGTTADEVAQCHTIIKSLEPRPGRSYEPDDTRYIVPDVYIHPVDDEFQVTLNDEGLPRLRVSPYYRRMLDEKQAGRDADGYLQGKLRSATWLIRSIEQRQRTLRKVAESIVNQQREFLAKGVEHLRPMVLKDVAQEIDMHESTVSRATANKYAHTPHGVVKLKYFFTSGIKSTNGSEVSSETVKQKIQEIVRGENSAKPFSDQDISVRLASDENIDIARRTVAKYRELLGILPSSKRKSVPARAT